MNVLYRLIILGTYFALLYIECVYVNICAVCVCVLCVCLLCVCLLCVCVCCVCSHTCIWHVYVEVDTWRPEEASSVLFYYLSPISLRQGLLGNLELDRKAGGRPLFSAVQGYRHMCDHTWDFMWDLGIFTQTLATEPSPPALISGIFMRLGNFTSYPLHWYCWLVSCWKAHAI